MQPKSSLSRVLIRCLWILPLLMAVDRTLAQDDSTLGHWRFQDDLIEGQQLCAVVGADGTIHGTATLDTQMPSSLVLDGQNDWVVISDDLGQAALPVRAMTVESWVRIDAPKKWGAIATAMQDNGSYERGWLIGNRDAKFCFAVSSIDRKRLTYLSADDAFVSGAWYYVVATYDGETMRLYVDGRLAAESLEQSGDIFYPERGVFGLGAYRDDDEFYPCAGRLAEVRLHKNVLSAAEIGSRFEAHKDRFPAIEAVVSQVVGWPTYMHDNTRSGQTQEQLTLPLNRHWSYKTRYPLAPAWPLPAKQNFWRNQKDLPARVAFDRAMHVVSDCRHVIFGTSADDRVVCLEMATGKEQWSFATEGPVRFAPTLHDGQAYVGSDDGQLYCIRVADGELAWQFRAGPRDHRIPGNGRMISLWPIRSGVIIDNGHARFAAGLFPNQGTYQYALDATTGKLLAEGQLAFSPQGYMQLEGNAIKISQGRAPSTVLATLESTSKTNVGRVMGNSTEFPFAWIGTAEHLIGGGDGQVAAFTKAGKEVWRAEVLGRAYGLAFADGKLLVSTDQGRVYCFGSKPRQDDQNVVDRREEVAAPSEAAAETARFVTSYFKNQRGYCLLLGDIDPAVTSTLVDAADWRFVCRRETQAKIDKTRTALDAAHLAMRAAVHHGGSVPLPYGSGLFNVVIVPSGSKTLGSALIAEVARVLRPAGGRAFIRLPEGDASPSQIERWLSTIANRGAYDHQLVERDGTWLVITRKTLRGAGQWTHLYASASNTACSDDRQIDDRLTLQWFGPPGPREMVDRHHRTVSPLFCDGRLFVPGNERVYGVDAYNGTPLWEIEIPGSRRVAIASDCGSMAATPDTLYVVAGDSCHRFEAGSGQALVKFDLLADTDGEPRHWGYVAAVGDALFGSTIRPNAARSGHSKQQISEAYYDAVPLVTSDSVFAVDRHTGGRRWQYQATAGAIVNSTITIGGDRLYFVESGNPKTLKEPSGRSKLKQLAASEQGANLVALNVKDGSVAWQAPIDLGSIEHHLFMSYARNKLIVVGTRNQTVGTRAYVWYDTHCVSAEDGKPVWTATQNQRQSAGGSHGEQDHHPVIVGDTVFVEPYAYHLETGQRTESWSLGRGGHGCGSISASAKMCFFRAGNPTMCELASGTKTKVTRVSRPGCWINMIPAGGLVLIPEASSGCVCDYPIQASMAFASRALSDPTEDQ